MLVVGCGSKEMPPATPSTPEAESPVAQVESPPDAALAIAFANNWLLKPDLAKAVEVRAMLEEAKAVKPKEVGAVLEQFNLQVSVMEQAKRFDDAVGLLKSGDADGATSLLTDYLQTPHAKDQEKAKQYLAMLKKAGSIDEAKTWLNGLTIEELEQIQKDEAKVFELMAETEPIKTFQDGVGKIWLAKVQIEVSAILQNKRNALRGERLAQRLAEWSSQKETAIKRTMNSDELIRIIEARHSLLEQIYSRGYRRDFEDYRASEQSDLLVMNPKYAMQAFGTSALDSTLQRFQRSLKQDSSLEEATHLTLFNGRSKNPGIEFKMEYGGGIERIVPLFANDQTDGNFFNSFGTTKLIDEVLFGDKLQETYDTPQGASMLCIHDTTNQTWWIVDKYYHYVDQYSRVISAFSGLDAGSPEELYRVTFDTELREAQYVEPSEAILVNKISGAPWTVLHLKLPDCPGWLASEGKLLVKAGTASGKVGFVKVSQSSKDQVLVDVYVSGLGTGDFQIQWTETSDEGEWEGQSKSRVNVIKSDVAYNASEIAKVVRFGNQTVGGRTKFRATQQDEDIVLKLRFPTSIRAIERFEYNIASVSYKDRLHYEDYLNLETGVEILFDKANRSILKTWRIQEARSPLHSSNGILIEDSKPDTIGLNFGPVLSQAKEPFFSECFLRFKILKGKMFDLDKLSFRVTQPE